MNHHRVLVADDDAPIRNLLGYNLRTAGFETQLASSGTEAIALASDDLAVALIDLRMPGADGMEVLHHFRERHPQVPVVMISAHAHVRDALAAVRAGAFEYLNKPFVIDELIAVTMAASRYGAALRENRRLREAHGSGGSGEPVFAGSSAAARQLKEAVSRVAVLDATVLVTGESGSGKGLLARMIHRSSSRSKEPMISLSCSAIPRNLFESELFGHEKGAFEGAQERRIGRVELAEGGTLLLDEVGDLPLIFQPQLLDFLQERRFQRVGGISPLQANVRVIASTNVDLRERVSLKEFREDLFYRLNVIPIHVPPLRNRTEDIPELSGLILNRIALSRRSEPARLSDAVLEALKSYSWPGNIRELENVLERAVAYCDDGQVALKDLPVDLLRPATARVAVDSPPAWPRIGGTPLEELERQAILQTLDMCRGNKAATARMLGVTEKTIYNKIARMGIRRPLDSRPG
jgi:DNA-binding NtrC family response regulator